MLNNEVAKFRTKIWIEKNNDARGTYNTVRQIKDKTTVSILSFWDCSNAYVTVAGIITFTIAEADAAARQAREENTQVIFKNCAPFTDCISVKNIIQVDNAKDLDIGMPMCRLMEYSNRYSKTSGILCQYCRDKSNAVIKNSDSFKLNSRMTRRIPNDCNTKDLEIAVLLKYLKIIFGELSKCHTLIAKKNSY